MPALAPLRNQLLDLFAAEGWESGDPVYPGNADWAEQILELKKGEQRKYLCFLVENVWMGNRRQSHGVLGLSCLDSIPESRTAAEENLFFLTETLPGELEAWAKQQASKGTPDESFDGFPV